jgi:hypothetical protein
MSEKPRDERESLLVELAANPWFAHELLFKHRHPDATPSFHYEIIRDLHGSDRRVLELAFRGAAKSTRAEEYITIGACFRRFRNFIIVGESATRACERLAAIKHELDYNEQINYLFGSLHGDVWNEDKIVLTNGVVLQAFGRGQSLRGTKHEDVRPDGCLIDDVEDEESVATPEGRNKVHQWFMRTLLPALAPGASVRMLANLLDPDCLAARLRKSGVWTVREYPWEHISGDGDRVATWPSRFSLEHIDQVKAEYEAAGMMNEYMQEYMVQAMDPSSRTFTSDLFKVVPRVRTWEPTYAVYDPARTVKATSSYTGKVVFSWIGQRMVIWEAEGKSWMPDEIVEDIFKTALAYQPIKIGVEKNGLEEFLLQPIRSEMLKRQSIIPVVPLDAPAGKLAFIRSLRPFFTSGLVEFAKDLPDLQNQLLSFPTGKIDTANALAYAPRMRPGLPIYEDFGFKNVQTEASERMWASYLVVNATRQYTAGVLVSVRDGVLSVLRDWVREGDPGTCLDDIRTQARLIAGSGILAYAPRNHWRPYDTIGLQPAARRIHLQLAQGGELAEGRETLRRMCRTESKNQPCLQVAVEARWTLNAFLGGYARSVTSGKPVVGEADEGVYKVLMEGLEAFAAINSSAYGETSEDAPTYAMDAQGRRYLSARPTHHGASRRG